MYDEMMEQPDSLRRTFASEMSKMDSVCLLYTSTMYCKIYFFFKQCFIKFFSKKTFCIHVISVSYTHLDVYKRQVDPGVFEVLPVDYNVILNAPDVK